MAINYYRQPRTLAPSRTNIVRKSGGVPAVKVEDTGAPDPTSYFGTTSDTGGFGTVTLDTAESARIGAGASRYGADKSSASSRYGADSSAASSRYGADSSAASSKYKNDLDFLIEQTKIASEAATAAAAAKVAAENASRLRLGTGAQAGALQGLLAKTTGTGSYREGADTLLGLLAEQETTGKASIGTQYEAAKKLLGEQYGRASGLLFGAPAQGTTPAVTGAYPALTAYLQANPPQAYANTTAAAAPVTQNALAQYMQAQGVGPGVTEQEVAAQNTAAQAGQGNYAGLLDVLKRQETAGQNSRLTEAQQASTFARTGLEAQNAQAGAGLTQQQQTALDTLSQTIGGQRFGVEQGATERKQTLQDALTALLGTGYNITGPDIAEDIKKNIVPEKASSTVAEEKTTETVAAEKATEEKATATPKNKKGQAVTTDWQKKVFAAQPNFTGTFNEAKKKFPKLYAAYLASQKKK